MTAALTPTTARDDRGGLLSASSTPRCQHCPGSKRAEAGLPELPDEGVTQDGNLVHEAMETGDDSNLPVALKDVKDAADQTEKRELANWRVEKNISDPIECIREGGELQRFWFRNRVTLDPMASSRPDVVYTGYDVDGIKHALVINYKTGFKRLTPNERDWQSRVEVLTVWHELGPERIRGAMLKSRFGTHFDYTDYALTDLERIERELRHIVWQCDQPDAPRVPGEWCRYCRAQGAFCRENAVYAMIAQHGIPMTLKKGEEELVVVQSVERMTPAELGFVYARKSVVESVFSTIAHRLRNLPEDQLQEAGFKLGPGKNNYPIKDVPAAFDKLSEVLTEDERKRVIEIHRGAIEEILREKHSLTKDQAKEKVIALLGLQPKEGTKTLRPL